MTNAIILPQRSLTSEISHDLELLPHLLAAAIGDPVITHIPTPQGVLQTRLRPVRYPSDLRVRKYFFW